MKRLLLFFVFALITVWGAHAVNHNNEVASLLRKTKLASYYDSTSVRVYGELCIALARKHKDLAAECEVNIYYGNYYFYIRRLDKAEKMYAYTLKLARAGGNKHFDILARIRLAYVANEKGLADAEEEFKKLLVEARKSHDIINQIECLNAQSILLRDKNLDKEATDVLYQALKLAEDCREDRTYLGTVLNNIGLIKLDNNDPTHGEAEFNRGLKIADEIGDFRLAIHLSNNLAIVYLIQDKFKEALDIDKRQIEYARKTGFARETSVAYTNLAFTLFRGDSLDASLPYYDSAITLLNKMGMFFEITKPYLGKAMVYRAKKQDEQAIQLVKLAESIATRQKNAEDLMQSYRMRYLILRDRKDFKNAIEYLEKYNDLNDSLRKLRNSEAIAELTVKYEAEKKELALQKARQRARLLEKDKQLMTQESKLNAIRTRTYFGIGIALAITLAIIFYIRWIRTRRKQQERFAQRLIENIDKERGRIARDLHDDLGQSLSAIKSRLSLGISDFQQREMDEELGRVIEQTRQISRQLYPSYLEKVGLKLSIARLAETTQQSTGMQCSCEIDEAVEQLSSEKKTHIFRILQECVNNTIKHAGASALKISIEQENLKFQLEYLDNGRAANSEFSSAIKSGMGMLSIRERARMLGGEAQMSYQEGRGFRLLVIFK